jgi:hypothetical protein
VPQPHSLLIVEQSQLQPGQLWRFGRADAPLSTWGLIQRNITGGLDVVREQADVPLSDSPTALCLVSQRPDEQWIEYDVARRPAEPVVRYEAMFRAPAEQTRMTLGERAAAGRFKKQTKYQSADPLSMASRKDA